MKDVVKSIVVYMVCCILYIGLVVYSVFDGDEN